MIKIKLKVLGPRPNDLCRTTLEVERCLAASKDFPYWTFWYAEDANGDTRARFFRMEDVVEVDMIGKDADDEQKPNLAQVIPIHREHDDVLNGGDDLGPVS